MKIMVDPPEGWKYNFPKEFDPSRDPPIRQWLVEQGYPAEIIESMGSAFFVRTWAGSDHDFVPGLGTLC